MNIIKQAYGKIQKQGQIFANALLIFCTMP